MIFQGIFLAGLTLLIYYQSYKIIAVTALLIVGIVVLVYFKQNSLLYMPVIPGSELSPKLNTRGYRHPIEQGMDSLNLKTVTADNETLQGWLVKADQPKRILIYFHENAGNIGMRIPFIKQLSERTDSDVILMAYRGFSDSTGVPTEQGLQRDAEAILDVAIKYRDELQRPANQKQIFVFGRSLGGAVSIYLSSQERFAREIKGVILENTFTCISEMIDSLMPVFKYIKFVSVNKWPSVETISRLRLPVLMIRSVKDEIVPTGHMVKLRKAATNAVYLEEYVIERGTHNVSWEYEPEVYFNRFVSFMEHCAAKH